MKQIEITQGKFALVDDEDYEYLNQFKWCATKGWNDNWYAVRSARVREKKEKKMVYMHREVMNFPKNKVDHKDHNGLNNQKENLRVATDGENSSNTTSRLNSSSPYIGVYLRANRKKKWAACIRKGGVTKYIGSFYKIEDAALAYNEAAKLVHGEFANLNQVAV